MFSSVPSMEKNNSIKFWFDCEQKREITEKLTKTPLSNQSFSSASTAYMGKQKKPLLNT